MARIDYDIFCFERVLSVEVPEQDKEKALEIIDNLYCEWNDSDTCECCEEYILNGLEDAGIKYNLLEAEQ